MTTAQTNVHFDGDESARAELGCALPGWEFQGFDQVSVHIDRGQLTLFVTPEQLEELAGSLLEVAAEGREALRRAFRDEWGPRIAQAGSVPEERGMWPFLLLIPFVGRQRGVCAAFLMGDLDDEDELADRIAGALA